MAENGQPTTDPQRPVTATAQSTQTADHSNWKRRPAHNERPATTITAADHSDRHTRPTMNVPQQPAYNN